MSGRFLLLGIVLITMVSADVKIKIEEGKLNLRIAGDPFPAKVGFVRTVECGQPVEITGGEGKLVIYHNDRKIKVLSEGDSAFIPAPHLCENFLAKLFKSVKKQVSGIYYTHEQGVGGVAKGIEKEKVVFQDIKVKRSDKNIMLYSDQWGALDIRLDLIRNNKIYKTIFFDDPTLDYAYFIVPVNVLNKGDQYKIVSNVGQPEHKGREMVSQSGGIFFESD